MRRAFIFILGFAAVMTLLTGGCAPAQPGSITGVVRFEGDTIPKRRVVDVSADSSIVQLRNNEPLFEESVIVGPEHGVANALVYVVNAPAEDPFRDPVHLPDARIDVDRGQYVPHVLAMRSTQYILLTNRDGALHNPRFVGLKGMPGKGMKIRVRAPKPCIGERFACDVHPWMLAYVHVMEHPYFALTGEDGRFEIKDLPPGTYEVRVWHEKLKAATPSVTLTVSNDRVTTHNFALGR